MNCWKLSELASTLLIALCIAGCSARSADSARLGSSAGAGGSSGSGGASSDAGSPALAEVLLLQTPAVTHVTEYYPFQDRADSYIVPGAPTNWLSPVDFADGKAHLVLDVMSVPEGSTADFYYTITWFQPGADDSRFLRPAIHVDRGIGRYEDTFPVRDIELVTNGVSGGPVGADWDFSNAFRNLAGDVGYRPNASYPITVRVALSLVP